MLTFFAFIFFLSIPAFLLGMVAPHVYGRFFKNGITRGKIAKIFAVTIVSSFIGIGVTAPPTEPKVEEIKEEVKTNKETEEIITDSLAADATVTSTEENTETETLSKTTGTVIKVVDGDTVTVEINGVRETIRIIGINTPETVDPRKPVECFGQEASARAHALLDNQTVTLEADSTQGERDKYDRLLRYVFLQNGSDFGKQMISEGYAYEYTYSTPYKYQQDYKTSQTDAESAKRGLWADDACEDTQDDSSASTGTTTTVTDTSSQESNTTPTTDSTTNSEPSTTTTTTTTTTEAQTTTTTATPESAPSTTTASCSCSADIYNCGNFTTHAEAQAVHDCCVAQVGYDIHKLDGNDNDGLACESLP